MFARDFSIGGCSSSQPELSDSPLTEELVRLSDVPKHLPRNRNGKKIGTSTVYRWSTKGVRGIRLACWQLPSGRVTSLEAVTRFLLALTEQRQSVPPAQFSTPRRRKRQAQKIERFLRDELSLGDVAKKGGV